MISAARQTKLSVFLPLWLNFGEDGISAGDVVQMVSSCVLLFVLTLAVRAAVWGIGRLADRRVLGSLGTHTLIWDGREIPLAQILAFRYRCFPCARLFRRPPSGLWLTLEGERLFLAHAPYWLRMALCHRCPDARHHATVGFWILLGSTAVCCLAVTIWLAVG